jgi:hypothetical protein
MTPKFLKLKFLINNEITIKDVELKEKIKISRLLKGKQK